MSGTGPYFAQDEGGQSEGKGRFVRWAELDAIEMAPGLDLRPIVGEGVMVSFVHFAPHTEAPLHWHEEEQIAFVVDGEFEFEVAGEKRLMRRGDAVLIPPNVPHAARTFDTPCFEVDVFRPPRRAMLEAMGLADSEE